MIFRKKLSLLAILVVVTALSAYLFPLSSNLVAGYNSFFYYPFQSLRNMLLRFIPFSVGDILYVAGGAALLATIVKWLYYITKFKTFKRQLGLSILKVLNCAVFVYLWFIWGWGANYYKEPLGEKWDLYMTYDGNKEEKRRNDSVLLVDFNKFLVAHINTYAQGYHYSPLKTINRQAKTYYQTFTDSKVKMHGLDIKPTMFTYFLERTGVEGYYNPFTGEGQISTTLPAFIMPFVVCHEMAHQGGIAAEGDANLMAYALGTMTNDSSFRYSGYLSIWLYANRRLYRNDSAMALTFQGQLNGLTKAHIDTLEELSKKYDNSAAMYSSELYDEYLKIHQQKEGLRSYGNVVTSAWQLELRRAKEHPMLISIP